MYSPLSLVLLTLAQGPAPKPVPLYQDLGKHHHAISSKVPQTQQYFDQGLRLVFGFNHGEAIRAFNEAARLDPNCAICYWGTALAYGPHVNAPMDSASGAAAYAAARKALSLAWRANPVERAYIQAVAQRYGPAPTPNRAKLDSPYARAMGDIVRQYPNDLH